MTVVKVGWQIPSVLTSNDTAKQQSTVLKHNFNSLSKRLKDLWSDPLFPLRCRGFISTHGCSQYAPHTTQR